MITDRTIYAVDSHTAGEPTRIVTGGIPPIPGKTAAEKKQYMMDHMDDVRTMLMHEPRGHTDMFGAILCEPTDPRADFGLLFMDTGSYLNMCGHGTMGAVTTILELGMLPMGEPTTKIVFDTPAGLVEGIARVENGRVKEVSVHNVDCFAYQRDITLEVPGWGPMVIDISFGGSFFAMVDADRLELPIVPGNASKLAELGMAVREAANRAVSVQHPTQPHINTVDIVEFYSQPVTPGTDARNVVILGEGMVDRSPCGTGTCAKMALQHARGKLAVGQTYVNESIIASTFTGKILEETRVGDLPAVSLEVTGRAFITGIQQFVRDPEDPYKNGFLVV